MKNFFNTNWKYHTDPIFGLASLFKADNSQTKVNLGIGAYKDENGMPLVLPVIRKVELQLAQDHKLNKEYLDMNGEKEYNRLVCKLLYGEENSHIIGNEIQSCQSLSGTGACRLGLEVLHSYHGFTSAYYSSPTWPIHVSLLSMLGYENCSSYPYYNPLTHSLNFEECRTALMSVKDKSVIVLHLCAHNPTGFDFSHEQWLSLANLFKEKNLLPFFDGAYMGFVTGDPEKDAYPVRLFTKMEIPHFVALSFSKILGLYNERIGLLSWYNKNPEISNILQNQIKFLVRHSYSNPPSHGSRIVTKILSDQELTNEWRDQLFEMCSRIKRMREGLYNRLCSLNVPGDWSKILVQNGLFSFTGLTEKQCNHLIENHHVYLIKNGRMNVSGLTDANLDYVANSIYQTLLQCPK